MSAHADRFEAAHAIATVLARAGIPQGDAERLIVAVALYGGPSELAELADKVVEAYEASIMIIKPRERA
jgi:hypothetical protein